jgi:hypothetical protein
MEADAMMRKLSLAVVLAFLLAASLTPAAIGQAAEYGYEHGSFHGPGMVELLMASTCPVCGDKGLAIGKDLYTKKTMYECRYGHRWTE